MSSTIIIRVFIAPLPQFIFPLGRCHKTLPFQEMVLSLQKVRYWKGEYIIEKETKLNDEDFV